MLETVKTALLEPHVAARWLLTDDLLQDGAILAGAAVVSGGLNYAFQVFMGRALAPEAYGVFGAVFALFYLVSVVTGGIRLSATRFTAAVGRSPDERAALHGSLLLRALGAGLVGFLVLALLSPLVADFLGLASVWPVLLVAATVPFRFVWSGNLGSLQGFQWFGHQASFNVLHAVVKLLLGVGLVLLGYGVLGAFAALVVAVALAVALLTVTLRSRLGSWSFPLRDHRLDYATIYRYLSPAVLAGFCITVPANVDVIVVSHFFSGEAVGHYVAASVLGKALVFLPMGISKSMFPKVTHDRTTNADRPDRTGGLLNRALVYAAAVAGSGALVFWTLPSVVLGTFFGSDYLGAVPLLRWYGLAILLFVLSIVVLNYELARDRMRFVYVFAVVSVAEIAAMWVFNGSMVGIIQVLLVANAGLLAFGLYEAKL